MVSDITRIFPGMWCCRVLILVLMEYGLWRFYDWWTACRYQGLNPCSNGIWSLTVKDAVLRYSAESLNPCSNGIWSLTVNLYYRIACDRYVLILVLMEYGLWLFAGRGCKTFFSAVLILVLMEYGLWPVLIGQKSTGCDVLILVLMEYGLWHAEMYGHSYRAWVLILVLMEYGLWPIMADDAASNSCLNPCSNGIWSLTLLNWVVSCNRAS